MTPKQYADHRGCAKSAVVYALKCGRLPSAVRDERGHWQIDAARADAEWAANTAADRVPLTGPTGKGGGGESLMESRARLDAARADLAELELAERRGELLRAADVERLQATEYAQAKTKLLGIVSRVRQRDPTLTPAQLALIEAEIRESLEDIASA